MRKLNGSAAAQTPRCNNRRRGTSMTFPLLDQGLTSTWQRRPQPNGGGLEVLLSRERKIGCRPRYSLFAIVETIRTAGTVPLFSIQCVVSLPAVKDSPAPYSFAASPRWSMILPDSTYTTSGRSL